jgi:hypothetical protein
VALALLVWIFSSVQELQVTVATQNVTIGAIEGRLQEMSNDRYRGEDAKRDLSLVHSRMDDLGERVSRLEKEIAANGN